MYDETMRSTIPSAAGRRADFRIYLGNETKISFTKYFPTKEFFLLAGYIFFIKHQICFYKKFK